MKRCREAALVFWRKYPDEKPADDGQYFATYLNVYEQTLVRVITWSKARQVFYYGARKVKWVTAWMPLPEPYDRDETHF